MKKKQMLFILTIFFLPVLQAQTNPVYNKMVTRGWLQFIEENKKLYTHEEIEKEFLLSMGYDDTTIFNLHKIDIDFSILHHMNGNYDEKVYSVLSDCIVIGVVKRKEYPMLENSLYNTIAYVEVSEFLRNDYNLSKSEIPVVIVSGPTPKNLILERVGEDTLKIGENVLLFLSASRLIAETKINQQVEEYRKLVDNPIVKFKILSKYEVKNGNIVDRRGSYMTMEYIKKVIDSVTIAINKSEIK